MTDEEFWENFAPKHITPKGKENPEGWDVKELLASLVEDRFVIDFGCGIGRLTSAFHPDKYLGIDLCEDALEIAQERNPEYDFDFVQTHREFVDCILLYTVCLHVNDDSIDGFLGQMNAGRVIIAEIMGEKHRGFIQHVQPVQVWNRSAGVYAEIMKKHGYELAMEISRPYSHYEDKEITFLVFDRCGF